MKYLLDTNVCVFAIQRPRSRVAARLKNIRHQDIAISVVTAAELLAGSQRKKSSPEQRTSCEQLIGMFQWIPFVAADAMTFGRIGASLLDEGKRIGSLDLQVSSTALNRNLIVVTHNTREFSRVPSLMVEDWQAELGEAV